MIYTYTDMVKTLAREEVKLTDACQIVSSKRHEEQ
jgi:hypothetical protein